jgi:hypothetical protein
LLHVCGDEILTTDQEILARIEEFDKRLKTLEEVYNTEPTCKVCRLEARP